MVVTEIRYTTACSIKSGWVGYVQKRVRKVSEWVKGQENKYRYKKKERRRDKRVAIKVSKGNNVVIFIHYTVINCRNKRYPKKETQSQVTKIENRGNCPVQVITNPSRLHSRMHLEAITTEPHLFERVLLEVPTTISYPTNKIIERWMCQSLRVKSIQSCYFALTNPGLSDIQKWAGRTGLGWPWCGGWAARDVR